MKFLAFEGLDGSGKSSLIKGLVEKLSQRNVQFITTREPGGTPLAEEIRAMLIRTDGESPTPRTEVLLYEAGRAQHVEAVIRPALKAGKWVITDRFSASTVAFQCGGRGLKVDEIAWLNSYATAGLEPDLNILLDLTVQESEKRREHRNVTTGSSNDRFEREARDFHERVRQSYLQQAQQNPKKWLILDSSQNTDILLQQLFADLKGRQWGDF